MACGADQSGTRKKRSDVPFPRCLLQLLSVMSCPEQGQVPPALQWLGRPCAQGTAQRIAAPPEGGGRQGKEPR